MITVVRPSSAHRWVHCTKSPEAGAQFPDDEPCEAAAEGTAQHELAAMVAQSVTSPATRLDPHTMVGMFASNGVPWDTDMADGANMYADDILAVMRKTGVFTPHIEELVRMPSVHPTHEGTPDCWLFDPVSGFLYIWDDKYGRIPVSVKENYQFIDYASGILDLLSDKRGLLDQTIYVQFTVVQPRASHRDGPIRRWTVPASELRGYINHLHTSAHVALNGKGEYRAGDWCKYCTARHACEALDTSVQEAVDTPPVAGLDVFEGADLGSAITTCRKAFALAKARLTGLEAQAEGLIASGENVPGWGLETAYGRQTWSVPAAEAALLGDSMGVDLRKPKQLITPKQAIKAGLDADVVKQLTKTPKTGTKLVEQDEDFVHDVFTNNGETAT